MRRMLLSLSVLAGLLFPGTNPVSANAAAGLTSLKTVARAGTGAVTDVGWHRGWRHGWHRGWYHRRWWGGPRIYFGWGWPYWRRYPYYYDNYYYSSPYYYGWRRHYRHHWRGYYWGHRRWHGHWHGYRHWHGRRWH